MKQFLSTGVDFFFTFSRSINKESIIDINAKVIAVSSKIESCTEQNLELSVLEIYLVSAAKPQLPLQIEDASRPEKNNVCATNKCLNPMTLLNQLLFFV